MLNVKVLPAILVATELVFQKPVPETPIPQPVYIAPVVSAKFRLLSTSCNLTNPEKSLALVSEPGKGDHWLEKGEQVGNFILEKVETGIIFYKDGTRVFTMNVSAQEASQMSQTTVAEKTQMPESEISRTEPASLFSPESLRHRQGLSIPLEPAGFVTNK